MRDFEQTESMTQIVSLVRSLLLATQRPNTQGSLLNLPGCLDNRFLHFFSRKNKRLLMQDGARLRGRSAMGTMGWDECPPSSNVTQCAITEDLFGAINRNEVSGYIDL